MPVTRTVTRIDLDDKYELVMEEPEEKEDDNLGQVVTERTVQHSYACRVLFDRKVKIFRNGKQILNQLYPFEQPELKTYLEVGRNYAKEFIQEGEEIKIIEHDYEYIKKLGWKISSRYAPGSSFNYQRTEYFLTPINSKHDDLGRIPEKHSVKVDIVNRLIQLIGKNTTLLGKTEWLPINPVQQYSVIANKNPFDFGRIIESANDIYNSYLPKELRPLEEKEQKPIPEVIIGITEMGELCCMEKTVEKSRDAPVITISGGRGNGKTFLGHNLICGFYKKYEYDIFDINDPKGDSQTRCMKWNELNQEQNKFLRDLQRFHESTFALPYVYLTPTIRGLQKKDVIYRNEVGFEVSIPFKKLLLDADLINYNKLWKLSDKSRKYIKDLIEDDKGNERLHGLLNIKSLEDANTVMDEVLPEDAPTMLRKSIFNVIKDIWNSGILDTTSKINSKWTVEINNKKYSLSPWNACIFNRLIPSLITKDLMVESYFAMWMKYALEDVFKLTHSKSYKRYLMICGDELVQMLREKATRDVIDHNIRIGRTNNVGFQLTVQYRQDIPDCIIANATHHFIFQTSAKKDLELIKKEFPDLKKTQIDEIAKLKKFQCYAIGTFRLYDSNGNSYSNNGEPIKIIRTKPPNAQHYAGKDVE